MRTLALVAFFALQLSAFTCGSDIHLHVVDSDMGHMTEHFHEKGQHQQDSVDDNGCHVHASHTFNVSDDSKEETVFITFSTMLFLQDNLFSKALSPRIEHPPQLQLS